MSPERIELEKRTGIEQQLDPFMRRELSFGVLSLDPQRHVTHSNVAFGRMFWPNGGAPMIGSTLREVFNDETASDLEHLLRRADRMSVTASQFEIAMDKDKLNVSVTVSSVQHGKQRLGYVVVFEDYSELLKAQREAAWRGENH